MAVGMVPSLLCMSMFKPSLPILLVTGMKFQGLIILFYQIK